jgi:hypothetical protein
LAEVAHKAGVSINYGASDLHQLAQQMTEGTPPKIIEYKKNGMFYSIIKRTWT